MNHPDSNPSKRLRDVTENLIEATHVGEPWQISAAQSAWDAEINGLVARVRELESALARLLDSTDVTHVTPGINSDGSVSTQSMARSLARAALAAGGCSPGKTCPSCGLACCEQGRCCYGIGCSDGADGEQEA